MAPKSPVRLARVLLPVVIIVTAAWGGAAWLRGRLDPPGEADSGIFEPKVGATLPDLQLHPIGDGAPVMLSSLPGKAYLLNFWATWCEACMVEMPSIVRLREKLKASGFEVLGVNMDEEPDAAFAKVAGRLKMAFPNFKDPDGELGDLFQLSALPLSVVFGADRKIVLVEIGDRVWDDPATVELIQKLLQGGSS